MSDKKENKTVDFATFPRVSRADSLRKILAYSQKQAFQENEYMSKCGRKRCAVGVTLPTEMIRVIKIESMNSESIDAVAKYFGPNIMRRLTGMSVSELTLLQSMNDASDRKSVLTHCRKKLAEIERRQAKKAQA